MAPQQPTYQAYTVTKREGQDDLWLCIDAAFMHQDGDGFNIVLQALPINGKIVLRLPKAEADQKPAKAGAGENTQGRRSANNRRDR